jgi:hypothetical protein
MSETKPNLSAFNPRTPESNTIFACFDSCTRILPHALTCATIGLAKSLIQYELRQATSGVLRSRLRGIHKFPRPASNLCNGLTHRDAAGVRNNKLHTRQESWLRGVSIQFGIARRSRYHLVHHLRPGVINSHFINFFFFYRPVFLPSPATVFSFQRTKQLESSRCHQ